MGDELKDLGKGQPRKKSISVTVDMDVYAVLLWSRVLSDTEISYICTALSGEDPFDTEDPYDPIPTIARMVAERNNKIIGGKQTVY